MSDKSCLLYGNCTPPPGTICGPACPLYQRDEKFLSRAAAIDTLVKNDGGGPIRASTLLDRTGAKAEEVEQ